MIHSLRSIFSSAPPRVLLVGGDRAILYLIDGKRLAQAAIAAKVDGEIVDLNRELPTDGEHAFQILTDKDPDALNEQTLPRERRRSTTIETCRGCDLRRFAPA